MIKALPNFNTRHNPNRRFILLGEIVFLILISLPIISLPEGYINSDAFNYLGMARYFYQTGEYIISPKHFGALVGILRSPLYPILLSLAFNFGGISIATAAVVTKGAAVGSLWIVYFLGKRLYCWQVGLLATALAATAVYLVDFPTHLLLDQVQAFFMLLSLLFFVLALQYKTIYLAWFAGIALGLGFLVKEAAVLFFLLPLLIILLTRPRHHLKGMALISVYWLGFALPVIIWWGYYFTQTGEIFLLNTLFFANLQPLFEQIGRSPGILILGGAVGIALIGSIAISGFKKRASLRAIIDSRPFDFLYIVVGWASVLLLMYFFFTTITKIAAWFYSFTEIWPRLQGFYDIWFHIRAVPEQSLMYYVPMAFIVITLLAAWKKSHSDLIICAAVISHIPLFLAMGFRGGNVWSGRYLMVIYWIGYLILARTVWLIPSVVKSVANAIMQKSDLVVKPGIVASVDWVFNLILLVGIAIYLYFTMPPLLYEHDPMTNKVTTDVWNNDGVARAGTWLKQKAAPGSNIASTLHHLAALDYYTDAQFWLKPLFDFDRVPGNPRPIDYNVSLFSTEDGMQLRRKFSNISSPHPIQVKFWFYQEFPQMVDTFEDFSPLPMFWALDQERLTNYLNEQNIEFLVITTGPHRWMFDTVPSFFRDTMEEMFVTDWTIEEDRFGLHIFKVNQHSDLTKPYPVSLNLQTLGWLFKRTTELAGDTTSLLDVFNFNPVLITPSSQNSILYYRKIAEAYLDNGKIDLAAFEYHLALKDSPEQANILLETAQDLAERYPDSAGPALLLGDIYYFQDNYKSAANLYAMALEAETDFPLVTGAAHQGLGKVSLITDQNRQAAQHLQQALDLTIFDAAKTRSLLLLAQGGQLLVDGDYRQAVEAYQQAVENSPATIVDLYLDTVNSKIIEAGDDHNLTPYREAFSLAAHKQPIQDELVEAFLTRGQQYANRASLSETDTCHLAALEAYRQAFTLSPTEITRTSLVNAYLAWGNHHFETYLKSGQQDSYNQTVNAYRRAFRLDPSNKAVQGELRQLYLTTGDDEPAEEEILSQLIAEETSRHMAAEAHLGLARRYLALSQQQEERLAQESLAHYRQALRLAPDHPLVRQTMVEVYLTMGSGPATDELLEQSLVAYQANISRNSNDLQSYWELATVYERLNQVENALSLYQSAVLQAPDNVAAHLQLAQALERHGQMERAIDSYEQVIALDAAQVEAYSKLGALFKAQNQTDKAVALYQQANKQFPQQAWPHVTLGQMYLEQMTSDE